MIIIDYPYPGSSPDPQHKWPILFGPSDHPGCPQMGYPLPLAHRPPVAPGQRKPPEVAPSLAKNDEALAGEETEPLPVKKLVVEPSTMGI